MNLQNPFNCNYGWTLDFKLLPNIFYNRTHEAVVLFFDNRNKDKSVIPNDKLDNLISFIKNAIRLIEDRFN